jgi:hypothetical protein
MKNEEAYKIGFLLRCAEEGLAPDQITDRVKQASLNKRAFPGEKLLAGGLGAAGKVLGNAFSLAKLGLIAGPPIAGAAGGMALAKARQDDFDPEEAKKRELIAEYQRALDQFKRSQRVQELA